jgi:DinB superfamily
MGRAAVEQLVYIMDSAFDSDEECLMANLRSVPDGAWRWIPPGANRSIAAIVGHVAACKWMYDNHAFGEGRMSWNDPAAALGCSIDETQSGPEMVSRQEITDWLVEGHQRLRQNVSALTDNELLQPRHSPDGIVRETRWIVANMARHDAYHAGEINHLRALMEGKDQWAWEY